MEAEESRTAYRRLTLSCSDRWTAVHGSYATAASESSGTEPLRLGDVDSGSNEVSEDLLCHVDRIAGSVLGLDGAGTHPSQGALLRGGGFFFVVGAGVLLGHITR